MGEQKLITFSISSDENPMAPEEIENSQFQKIHFRIYSADRVNVHNYTCSLKVLKKYAHTIAGKPILVWYNKYANGGKGDFAGHEDSAWAKEYPIGFFPNDVKITYEKDENNTYFLCADGYVWSLYYSEIVEVFKNYGGVKGVSCEMLVLDSEIIEGTDIENILQYSFAGLTLIGEHDALGNSIKPAVDGCCGILVTNASTNLEYEKAKVEFERILYSSVKQESVETDSFFIEKNKEETMETKVTKNSTSPEIVENAEQVVTTEVKVSTDTHTYDDSGNFIEATHETHQSEITKVVDVPEDTTSDVTDNSTKEEEPIIEENASKQEESDEQVVENASTDKEDEVIENACKEDCACKEENACKKNDSSCKAENDCKSDNASEEVENTCKVENAVSVEEFESLKQKYSELENQLAIKNTAYEILMQKCSELETYKNNKENENAKNAIEVVLNSVSHILNSSQIDEWRKESEKCSAENVDEFTNKLKAFAFDIQEKNGIIQADSIRNAIPKEIVDDSMDLWERIEKKYI